MKKTIGYLFMLIGIASVSVVSWRAFACGDNGEGGCDECGPHWGNWSGNCPSIVTNASVSPTTINQCGVTAPAMPTNIVAPVYSPTNIWQQTGTYDCGTP